MNNSKILLVIAGPTATGKTSLSIELAKHFKTEIISADSRQFYKEMSIGTAKPSPEELAEIKHHLIDSHSIHEDITAGSFESECKTLIDKLFKSHDILILSGGSGLFINAAIYGLDELPPGDQHIRDELQVKLEKEGITSLQEELRDLDPEYYDICDQNNPRRLIRAIEINRQSDIPYSKLLSGRNTLPLGFNVLYVALNMDREKLYKRIDQRVETMIDLGLVEEAQALFEHRDLNALKSVGYRELFEHFKGNCSLKDAIGQIKKNTRNYAKRQLTWFRKVKDVHWMDPNDPRAIIDLVQQQRLAQ